MPPHPTDEVKGSAVTAPRDTTPGTDASASPAAR